MIIIRHGKSRHNSRESDDLNSELTDKGIWQAQKTGEFLTTLPGIHNFEIVSSPLKRALQTSHYIAEILGCGITQDWRIREFGHTGSDFSDDDFPLVINSHKGWIYKEPESLDDLMIRLARFYVDYHKKDVIVVSHGLAIAGLVNLEKGSTEYPEWDGSIGNCSINRFIPDPDVIWPSLINYTEHLEKPSFPFE